MPMLFSGHFQNACVVRDVEKPVEILRRDFGIPDWEIRRLRPGFCVRALGLVQVDNDQIKLVEADPDHASIYSGWIPEDYGLGRIHHMAYLYQPQDDYLRAIARYDDLECPKVFGENRETFSFHFPDKLNRLGRYCKLFHMTPESMTLCDGVPSNKMAV